MKVGITGSTGLLGTAFAQIYSELGHSVISLSRGQIQKSNEQELAIFFDDMDFIVHTAANTNVELCEANIDECYKDNYLLTDKLAQACSIARIKLIFISSTGVYGNYQSDPYREYSETRPTTHHHRAKLLAESSVLREDKNNLVVRTGWLFGGKIDNPKNFVARRLEEGLLALRTGNDIFSNAIQRGCPTFTFDLVNAINQLLFYQSSGIFNLVNTGDSSRLEYVQAIYDIAGYEIEVKPADPNYFKRIANVSDNETASNWRATLLGIEAIPNWRVSLEKYVKKIASEIC